MKLMNDIISSQENTTNCLLSDSGAEQLDDSTDINITDCRRRKTLFISSFPDWIITTLFQ